MILAGWLLRRLAENLAFIWLGLAALLGLFDLLQQSSELTAGSGSVLLAHFFYVLFRLPEIISFFFPFAFLLAALVTFRKLAVTGEVIALQEVGWTLKRVTLLFAAFAIICGTGVFFLRDRVATAAAEQLEQWEQVGYAGLPRFESDITRVRWMAGENYLIKPVEVDAEGETLYRPTVIELNENGQILRYLRAESARWEAPQWFFREVEGRSVEDARPIRKAQMSLDLKLHPRDFRVLSENLEMVPLDRLFALGSGAAKAQSHTPAAYRTEAWLRLAWPLGASILLLFSAPLGAQLPRIGRPVLHCTVAILAGFLFFMVVRLFSSVGVSYEWHAWWIALAPHLLFSTTGLLYLNYATH